MWNRRVSEHPQESVVSATLPITTAVPPIAVLMMACDRVTVSRSIDQLLQYKHSILCLRTVSFHKQKFPLPSNRQHLSCGAGLEDRREDNQNCSVLCCVQQLCTMIHTRVSSSYILHVCLFRFVVCVLSGHCVLVLLALLCFFSTSPRDWQGRTSPKWLILCRVGRKTLT